MKIKVVQEGLGHPETTELLPVGYRRHGHRATTASNELVPGRRARCVRERRDLSPMGRGVFLLLRSHSSRAARSDPRRHARTTNQRS